MYSPGCGIPGVGCYETKMKSILPCAGSQTAERSPRLRLQSHRGTQTHQPCPWPCTICIHELQATHCSPWAQHPPISQPQSFPISWL